MHELPKARVSDHARDLVADLRAQIAGGGQIQKFAIGRGVPKEIRQLGRELVPFQLLRLRCGAALDQEQELRRRESDLQRVLDAVAKLARVRQRGPVDLQQRRLFGLRHRAPVGPARETGNHAPRIGVRVGLAVEVHENAAMRLWRPLLVERPFELHRADHQARHVAPVGVLAADADLADAGQVVDVVLLHVGTREVLDRALEHEVLQVGFGHGLGSADRCKGAAAVAPEAKVDSEARNALFKCLESPGHVVVGVKQREHDPVQVLDARRGSANGKRARFEPDG